MALDRHKNGMRQGYMLVAANYLDVVRTGRILEEVKIFCLGDLWRVNPL